MTKKPPRKSTPGAKVLSLHGGAPVARPAPRTESDAVERAFAAMAGELVEAADAPAAENAQLAIVQDLLKARTCFVSHYVPQREQLRVGTVRGRNDARIAVALPNEGPIGRAFSEARVIREDSLVAVPLLTPKGPQGCLVVLSPRVAASDALLQALAAQIVAATEVARLRDETVRRNKDLQTAVAGLKSIEHNRDEMLANVSHDLKNPLTTIKTYLGLLRQQRLGPVQPKQDRALETCERNSDRLLKLIEEMVLLSRLKAGEMELDPRPFGLKALLEEILGQQEHAAQHAGVALTFLPSSEVYVRGSRARLHEALSNVVENALEMSRTGTTVELELLPQEGGLARLRVQDRGTSLEADEVAHLFDSHRPFSRRRAGLGLPVAAKIVELHGGRIGVEPVPGVGNQTLVTLPMFAGPLADPGPLTEPREGGILIVEDDEDCREVLRELLELEGYRVLTAPTATQARALLSHIRPAMVLLDLRLSDEDGRTVLRHIRETPAMEDLPVYVISGASDAAQLLEARGVERIHGFFEKPLQLGKMLPVIAQVVRPARSAPVAQQGG